MRIVKDPRVRKQEIIDTSLVVFAEKGYEKTSISDIAKAMNISQGLCYRYFRSKGEIYDAALEEYADAMVANCMENIPEGSGMDSWMNNIGNHVRIMMDNESGNEAFHKLFQSEDGHRVYAELLQKVIAKLEPSVVAMLEKLQADGMLTSSDLPSLAIAGLYGEMGLLLNENYALEQKVSAIVDIWTRLLK